ncbi:22152_t:CDS:2, partial [Dentiscutata erythropus]
MLVSLKELKSYASQLKTHKGCPSKDNKNLNLNSSTISLVPSSSLEVDKDINNSTPAKIDDNILPLSITPSVLTPFEELRLYTFQLKAQLGCSLNTSDSLEIKSNNSSILALAILLEK